MPADSPPASVTWRDVSKRYPDGHHALEGVNLEVGGGECLAILGSSGSGKTTLLKMVNRLIEPSTGTVLVRGTPTSDWDPITLRRSIGYVIQEVGLLPHLDIASNVALTLRIHGKSRKESEPKVRTGLQMVGLDPDRFGSLRPHQLSGGQRQRVGVARALATDPDLILMDEPFGALDPITRREIQDEFVALRRRLNKTVIIVTHDIREACRIADRLALVDRGRLVQQGSAAELIHEPRNEFVKSFFQEAGAVAAADPEGS